MNKLMKGAISGAAAIALLMGGAGTFAYWNATETIDAGTISTGELKLETVVAGKWEADGSKINPANYKVIPGQNLRFTQTLKVKAPSHLNAELTLDAAHMAQITSDLKSHGVTPLLKINGSQWAGKTVPVIGGDQVEFDLTFTIPFGTAIDNTTQNLDFNFDGVVVTVTQKP